MRFMTKLSHESATPKLAGPLVLFVPVRVDELELN